MEGLKRIPPGSVDYVITDPPYNVDKAEWDVGVLDLLDKCAEECARVLKPEGLMLWFTPTKYLLKIGFLISQHIRYRWSLAWVNNELGGAASVGFSKYTLIMLFSNAESVHRNIADVFIHKEHVESKHPTPKPLGLLRDLVLAFTREGDVILDPFMGSGTTAVACKQLNRRFIGFEVNEDYVRLAEERLKQASLREIFSKEVVR